MRLSRKKAIELCIELWTWLAKTGKKKEDWPEWKKYGDIKNDCWFCEHLIEQQKQNDEKYPTKILPCSKYCIYHEKYGGCQDSDEDGNKSIFDEWDDTGTPEDRKKYAKLFLGQIKQCK
ncbi:hypothetical protein LCGC14_2020530 [marine sediment metagenome]|uniref:Uncharacterized protein n=1 Tax=marine sediment metagenome TaxID=412755 RepID=A0A0F9EXQ7_9ZZZZ